MFNESKKLDLISIRRELHRHPEIGYKEFVTTEYILNQLDGIKINATRAIKKTGLVGSIGKGDGKTILLRADIDALPIQENTNLDYSSKYPGFMHACGHDIHTTILLGALENLNRLDFKGTIKFVFQPSEEGPYDDFEKKSGGQRIAESGFIDDVDYCLSLHVHPLLKTGKIGFTEGVALSNSSFFRIKVNGISGHAGATPHLGKDAALIASTLVTVLNTIVSRDIDPFETGVVSITMINGGVAPNVIADFIELRGTIRALYDEQFEKIKNRIEEIVFGFEKVYGVTISFELDSYYPSLFNHLGVHEKLKKIISNVFDNGLEEMKPSLAGEDFAFYSKKIPSAFYFIGAQHKEDTYFLHNSKVQFDEKCIDYGVEFLTKSSIHLLE